MKEILGVFALLVFAWCFYNQKWGICALMWSILVVAITPAAMQVPNILDRVFTVTGMYFMTGVIWTAAIWQRLDAKQKRNG